MLEFASLPSRWPVTVTYDRIQLAPLTIRHRRAWAEVRERNAQWITPWDATFPFPAGDVEPSFRTMIRQMNRDGRDGVSFPWGLFVRDRKFAEFQFAGQLVVAPVQYGAAFSASLGYWIDERWAGQGLTPLAVAVAGDYLFQNVGLHRLEINIVPRNAPSLRVVEKLGLRFEGLREKFLHINGAWEDHYSYAITAEELDPQGLIGRLAASQKNSAPQN